MLTSILVALGSLLLLALAFVPLERMFPARPGQRLFRPRLVVDLAFFAGQYLVFSSLSLGLLLAARDVLARAEIESVTASFAELPFWYQVMLAVGAGDVLVYWFHRACHAYEPLWRFHAVHHSAEHLDFLAAHREHPLDGLVTQLCVNLPAFLLGFPSYRIAAFFAFRGIWAVFIHSNVKLPLGPLGFLLGAPDLHHWHHARAPKTQHNFSNLAPWVDWVFGTYHRSRAPQTYPLGLAEAWPNGYWGQLIRPFRPPRRWQRDRDFSS